MPKDDRYAHLGGDVTDEDDLAAESDVQPSNPPTEPDDDASPAEEGLRVTIQHEGEEVEVPVDADRVTVDDLRAAIQQTPHDDTAAADAGATSVQAALTMQRTAVNVGLLATGAAVGGAVMLFRNRRTKN